MSPISILCFAGFGSTAQTAGNQLGFNPPLAGYRTLSPKLACESNQRAVQPELTLVSELVVVESLILASFEYNREHQGKSIQKSDNGDHDHHHSGGVGP